MNSPMPGSGTCSPASIPRALLAMPVALALWACSNVEPPSPSPLSVDDATHSLAALDGVLLGADRGEFGGYLAYRDRQGNVETLLLENVHGIVENQEGIFVLTGLSHLGMSAGNLYRLKSDADGTPRPVLLGYLPGAPSHVVRDPDATVHFLIEVQDGSGEGLYRCHALRGATVSYSNNCAPPTAVRTPRRPSEP